MTAKQRDLIDNVVLPKLVEMALDGTLPMDMNDLHSSYFEDEIKTYNNRDTTKGGVTEEMIDNAYMNYVSMEREDAARVLREIYNDSSIEKGSVIDHAHDDFQIIEKFEYTFTVGDFFDQIRL